MLFDYAIVVLPFLSLVYGIFIGLGLFKITVGGFVINVLLFLIFSIIAGLVNNAISYFIGLMVFYTDHLFGLNMARNAVQAFLGGQLVPLSYMGVLGVAFSYTPFAFMNAVPVLILMGKIGHLEALFYLMIALGWVLVIEIANKLIFKHAMTKLTVQGG